MKPRFSLRPFVLLLLPLLMIALVGLGCGGSASSTVSQPREQRPPVTKGYLDCPDCEAEGMAANIWTSTDKDKVACRADWKTPVRLTSMNDTMFKVDTGACEGWISKTLVTVTP